MQHTMNFESIAMFAAIDVDTMEIPVRSPKRLYSGGSFTKDVINVDEAADESSLEEQNHDTSSISDGSVFSDNEEYEKKEETSEDIQEQCLLQEEAEDTDYFDDELLEELLDEESDICTIDGVVEIIGIYGEESGCSSKLSLIDV